MTEPIVGGRVSAVIPCYNGARYLGGAIESALSQTYPDVEVVVADDGSTDATPTIAASFGPRVRLVRQRNAGPAAARNAAIRVATGEYVALLDHDDRYHPEKLARQVPRLASDPGVGMVYCGWRLVDEAGAGLPEQGWPHVEGDLTAALLLGNLMHPVSVVARRALVVQVGGFDETLPVNEDWDLFLRLSRTGARWACVDEPLCDYRLHAGQSHERVALVYQHHVGIVERAFADPTLAPDLRELRTRALQLAHLRGSAEHYRTGDAAEGRAAFARAVALAPAMLLDVSELLRFLRLLLPEGHKGRAALARERRGLVHTLRDAVDALPETSASAGPAVWRVRWALRKVEWRLAARHRRERRRPDARPSS